MAAIATAKFTRGNLDGLLAKVGTGLYDGVSQAAAKIEGEAKQLCPVDTGALQASISTEITRGIQNMVAGGSLASSMFGVSARVAPHQFYAAYVEFGAGVRGMSSAGAGPGPYNPHWKGMAAQPYMRPALDNNKDAAVDIIAMAVKNALA